MTPDPQPVTLPRRIIREAVAGLGSLLFPPLCPLCRAREPASGSPFCPGCRERALPLQEPWCPLCGLPFAGRGPSHPCPRCLVDPPPFEALRAWGTYEGGLLELIHALKYGGRIDVRGALADLVVEALRRHYGALRGSLGAVVPVPCTRRTLRRRGFDLPALLARRIARALGAPWRPTALIKDPDAPDLVGLTAPGRADAVARAYGPAEPLPQRVLLVDDVATTTATARACARACRASGAEQVWVLVLARTPRPQT